MEKLNKSIAVVISLVVIVALIFGIHYCQINKKIDSYESQISKMVNKFEKSEKRDEKLDVLQSLLKDYEVYKTDDCVNDKTDKLFKNAVNNEKDWFNSDYSSSIEKNTLDYENIDDKQQLKSTIKSLKKIMKTINQEKEITLNEDEYDEYQDQINDLIDKYNARIDAIEAEEKAKAEAEAAAAAEAERKAAEEKVKEEAEAKEKSNQSASNNSSNDTSNDNSVEGNNGANNRSGNYEDIWSIDENGNEIPGTRVRKYENGDVYDENGNWLFNCYTDEGL